jgi:hypothetical protein
MRKIAADHQQRQYRDNPSDGFCHGAMVGVPALVEPAPERKHSRSVRV